jgi:hypothetical protein
MSGCVVDQPMSSKDQYLIDYLEEKVSQLTTNYASQEFARQLGFTSARMSIDRATDNWLARDQDL